MKLEALHTKPANRLLLVDGHAYAYRAFFAIRSLSAPDGRPTNAIYGFISMLNVMMEAVRPTHVCVVWDGGLSSERTGLLPGYKAQRPPMPEGLEAQLDPLVAYLRAAGLDSYCGDGIEADDYIGCVAVQASLAGFTVVIASSDKDFMQLVSDRVFLLKPGAKDEELMGPEEVERKTGVRPAQIVDWLSLVGDAVDNIAGAPGIGPKTAAQLLVKYGSLDGIYERLEEVMPLRVKAALEASKEALFMNRRLIRLRTEMECGFSAARFSLGKRDPQALRALYQAWGFRRMAVELDRKEQGTPELALK